MTLRRAAILWTRDHSIAELCRRCGLDPRGGDMHQLQKWLKGSRKTLPARLQEIISTEISN